MSNQPLPETVPESYGQLTQVRVPLEDATFALMTRGENGQLPILVMPERINRIRTDQIGVALVLLIAGWLVYSIWGNLVLLALAIISAVALIILAVYRSFLVIVPEGVNALLSRGGRHQRTIGSGTQILPPYIVVSHLVTKREIPYDVPVIEALTLDGVRANIDLLVTFSIVDPYMFVYSISADDFDKVLQAACQDALRTLIRTISVEQLMDLQRSDTGTLLESINADIESYGVRINKIAVTYTQPPAEFLRSHEARQLAIVQRAEQEERQALAKQRQTDAADLASRRIAAEAAAESLRLQQLEERLLRYPTAAQYDLQTSRLKVAGALAGNSRTVLQVRSMDDLSQAPLLRDIVQDEPVPSTNGNGENQAVTQAT